MTVKVIKVDGGSKQDNVNVSDISSDDIDNMKFRKIDVVEVSDSDNEVELQNSQIDNNSNDDSDSDDDSNESEEEDYDDESDDESSESGDDSDAEDPDTNAPKSTEDEESFEDDDLLNGGAGSDTVSSVSTTEILGKYPLFLVLTEFLMDDEGNNIVHVLHDINRNLAKIAKRLGSSDKKKGKKDRK